MSSKSKYKGDRFDNLYKYIEENYIVVEVFGENALGTRYIDFLINDKKYIVSYNSKSDSYVASRNEWDIFYFGRSLDELKQALSEEEEKGKVVNSMAKEITVLVVKSDVRTGELVVEKKTIADELDVYYKLIGCSCIDIQRRYIYNKQYALVFDDEFRLKNDVSLYVPTMEADDYEEELFGVVVIANDKGDELTSLTEKDVQNIKKCVVNNILRYRVW